MSRPKSAHGTYSRYANGCRCDACRAAGSERNKAWHAANRDRKRQYDRAYREANRERIAQRKRTYYEANRDYKLAEAKAIFRRNQESSREAATVAPGARWQPHEDALLERISSDVAAASALGRTVISVKGRRRNIKNRNLKKIIEAAS